MAEISMTGAEVIKAVAVFSAGMCMAVGAIGTGLSEGYAAAKACEAVGNRPDEAASITRTMIIGQAVTETVAIYCLVVALVLIFVV
ncbi:MAG: ATP synthase F0 subunit C [Candidatus Margulisiibacteriota bacterium]